jgi:hypothetical protein
MKTCAYKNADESICYEERQLEHTVFFEYKVSFYIVCDKYNGHAALATVERR